MSASRNNKSQSDAGATAVDVALVEKRGIHSFFNQPEHQSLKSEFLRLNQISNFKAFIAVAKQWMAIFCAFGFALWVSRWWSYAAAIIVIATRQHALSVLMHEATHWRLFSKRWANDLFGNVFCAFPVLMMVSRYRAEHLAHHQANMSDADPYQQEWSQDSNWHWPKTPVQAVCLFAGDLVGLNLLRLAPSLWRWSPWSHHSVPGSLTVSERLSWYGFVVLGAIGLTATGLWLEFFLLWILPLLTVMITLVRARTAVEHLNLPGTDEFNRTRHIQASWIEKLTVSPLNINMHLAHHLFPSVPQYNLPRLHQLLLRHPGYRQGCLYDSYLTHGKAAFADMIKK